MSARTPDDCDILDEATLLARLAGLAPGPADEGAVALVVARPDGGARHTPPRAQLDPEVGLEGDRWARGDKRLVEAQLSLMNAAVARVFANGQPLERFGDNLIVELDLSPANLPVAARLRVGSALCE